MAPQMDSREAGFTLIEMLVVIAILAVVLGMVIPAVIRVREASNRTTCSSNMRQIGEAGNHFHDTFKRFPEAVQLYKAPPNGTPDSLSVYRNANQPLFGPNWAILLLPYIEKENLFRSANPGNYMRNGDQGWRRIRSVPIPLFICPSDTGRAIGFSLPDNVTKGAFCVECRQHCDHLVRGFPALAGLSTKNWLDRKASLVSDSGWQIHRRDEP
jgi:prepilin-type N-terminal cleavage/methylation domain-containing protein